MHTWNGEISGVFHAVLIQFTSVSTHVHLNTEHIHIDIPTHVCTQTVLEEVAH